MSENLKDILSNLNPEIDQETLMLYLQGKLSAGQEHEVEKGALQDEFEADALEGLSNLTDDKKIALIVDQLKADLKKKTRKKQAYRRKREVKLDPIIIISVILILLLAIVSFFILHNMKS